MFSIFDEVGESWRGLTALGAAFVFGSLLAVTLSGFSHLPGRVARVEARTARLEDVIDVQQEQLDLLVCIQKAQVTQAGTAMGCFYRYKGGEDGE